MATNPKISLVKGGKTVDGEFQANTGTQSETTYQAPNVSTLEKAPTPVSVPDSTTNVPDLPIYGFTQKTPEDVLKEQQLRAGQAGNAANLDSIYAGLLDIGTKGQFTQQAEEAAGIPQLNTQLTEIENELSQKSLGFRRERERILAAGGSKAQVDATLSEVGRKQNQELADLEVIRAARSNTLTNAQNLINRKVELEFGDKIAQVNALKFIYEENKDVLNKEDDRLFQKAIARESRAFEVAKQEYVQTETEKMRYVRNAAEAGASNETLKAIQGAKTLDDLYSLDGVQNFALSKGERLDLAYKQAQIDNIYDSINQRGVEAYNKAIEEALAGQEGAKGALQTSLAGAALALELQTKEGLDAAVGFGIKKSGVARTAAGALTGAAAGAAAGSVVPIVGTTIGAVAGGITGAIAGYKAGPDATAGTNRADFEAKAKQLAALISIDARNKLKGQGTITDSEFAKLEQAETILGNMNVSEAEYLSALNTTVQIMNKSTKDYVAKYGAIDPELASIYGMNPDGSPVGTELGIDTSGNIILPANSGVIISDNEFWKQ